MIWVKMHLICSWDFSIVILFADRDKLCFNDTYTAAVFVFYILFSILSQVVNADLII